MTKTPATRRAVVAGAIGVGAALVVMWLRASGRSNFSDFDHLWVGARALLAGDDPYVVVPTYGLHRPLYYPLPAIVVLTPLALLPLGIAHATFAGIGAACFAFAVSATGWWPLLTVMSFGTLNAIELGQWSMLTAGIAGLPWLAWLALIKPTTGGAVAAAYLPAPLKRRAFVINVVVAIALLGLSQLLVPNWGREWVAGVKSAGHFSPLVATPLGAALLFSLIRWRRPEARMLALLACVPQSTALYETVPLGLVVKTRLEAVVLVVGSAVAHFFLHATSDTRALAATLHAGVPVLLLCMYLPALVMILVRPNRSPSDAANG